MLREDLSEEDREAVFDNVLNLAVTQGVPCRSDTGLAGCVICTINAIAAAYPHCIDELVAEARRLHLQSTGKNSTHLQGGS